MFNLRSALVVAVLAIFGLAVLAFGPLRQAGIFDFGRGAEQPGGRAADERRDTANTAAKPSEQAAPSEGERQPRKLARNEGQETPAFDVVRVEPDGESVVAGRAAPGATVELLRNGVVHGRTVADAAGLFAMTPEKLPEGDHQLTLRFTGPDGERKLSKEAVAVSLAQKRKEPVIVALSAPDRPTVVLSSPEKSESPSGRLSEKAGDNTRSLSSAVAIETAEGSEGGKLFVSGRAAPGATVRLYLNDSYLASGSAGKDGKLSFSIASGVVPGDYRVRLDHVDPVSGAVKSRAEVPFNLPMRQVAAAPSGAGAAASVDRVRSSDGEATRGLKEAAAKPSNEKASEEKPSDEKSAVVVVPEVRTALVVRGESLWRISQRIYGEGMRYTVIYSANHDQIRNPHLIYPGQTFVLPNNPKN
jgi:nucleoid-associated protein YgaU